MAVVDDSVDRWLLEAKTPSIRYFTLRDLLHKPETDVQAERQAMAADGPISQILALQTETGQWANEYSYYTPKYRSTHWSMMLLTELGIDPTDERFQRGIDFMLSASQPQQEEHVNGSAYGLLCLWGNLLRYTAYGKQLDDPRALRLMVCIQQQAEQAAWRCPHNGGLPCVWFVPCGRCHRKGGIRRSMPRYRTGWKCCLSRSHLFRPITHHPVIFISCGIRSISPCFTRWTSCLRCGW